MNKEFGENYRGKHLRYCIIEDEQFCGSRVGSAE